MNMRKAVATDAVEIARVHVLAWQSAYRGIMPDEFLDSLSFAQKTTTWQHILANIDGHYDVVLQDDIIAGFMVWGPARDEDLDPENVVELVALNIAPDYWRRGYGAALVERLIESAKQQKTTKLVLWSAQKNTRAIAFYERLGFESDIAKRTDSKHCNAPIIEARYRLML